MRADYNQDYQANAYNDSATTDNPRELLILRSLDRSITIYTIEAIVLVNGSNEIIETPITGRAGTAKEFLSNRDDIVTINGSFHGLRPGDYPASEVERLIRLLKAQESIEVVSEHLKMFGITNIVIKSYTVNQVPGFTNRQTYTIQAVSDNPFEVEYNDEKDTI